MALQQVSFHLSNVQETATMTVNAPVISSASSEVDCSLFQDAMDRDRLVRTIATAITPDTAPLPSLAITVARRRPSRSKFVKATVIQTTSVARACIATSEGPTPPLSPVVWDRRTVPKTTASTPTKSPAPLPRQCPHQHSLLSTPLQHHPASPTDPVTRPY